MNYKQLTEQELIMHFNNKDHSAFREIYDRYFRFLYVTALKNLGNESDAKDLMQEIFMRLFTRMGYLRTNMPISAYLHSCISNLVISQKRHQIVQAKYYRFLMDIEACPIYSDYVNFEEKQMDELVRAEIAHLHPKMRAVFELNVLGVSHREISNCQNIRVNTVKSHIFQARRILRERLEKHFF